MKTAINAILIFIVINLLWYLVFIFVSFEVHIGLWGGATRFLFAIISFPISLVICGSYLIENLKKSEL